MLKGELKPLVNLLVTSPIMGRQPPLSVETNSTSNQYFHSNGQPPLEQDTFRNSMEVSPIRDERNARTMHVGSA